ncbi:hypothetical protein CR513_56666, partial [Mucuna pruriens]
MYDMVTTSVRASRGRTNDFSIRIRLHKGSILVVDMFTKGTIWFCLRNQGKQLTLNLSFGDRLWNQRKREENELDVKVEDNVIPQVSKFKYLRSILQNDGKINEGGMHMIQVELLKWRKTLRVICVCKISTKFKEKFYCTTIRLIVLYSSEY